MAMEKRRSLSLRARSSCMSFFSRLRSGLALPSVTVALTPARALTSHARRRYHERYLGRYRFPAFLFAMDLSVLALVLAIVGVGMWFAFWRPQPEAGLRLVFAAPPIRTATTIAFEARLSAQDGRTHSNTRLRWVLPPGTEVVKATPPVDTRSEALLGDVHPGEDVVARIAVRLLAPPGSVHLGFQVRSNDELLSGNEVRPIIGSALRLEELAPFVRGTSDEHVFVLRNDGNVALDCAHLHAVGVGLGFSKDVAMGSSGGMGDTQLYFDTIPSRGERVFSLHVAASQDVSLFCGETELQRLRVSASQPVSLSDVSVEVAPSVPGQETHAMIVSPVPLQVLVYHPSLREAQEGFRWFDVAAGTTTLTLPLEAGVSRFSDKRYWFLRPMRRVTDGLEALGPLYDAPITTPFSLGAEARYYAASGGQIGAGPLPPRVGQETRYWVQWKMAPITSDLSHVEMRATLPANVHWTQKSALLSGGELKQEGTDLVWRLPFLPATQEETTVAFEVGLEPAANARGMMPHLLEATHAQALENRSNATLRADSAFIDTSLSNDERAQGKGIVR